MTEVDCDFCRIIAGTEDAAVILRTEDYVAFFPSEPATLGHTLLVPVEHVPDIWSLSLDGARVLAGGVVTLAHAIRESLEPEGLNVVQSNGRVATQTIDHLHVHLVPRWSCDAMGPIWPVEPPPFTETAKDDALRSLRKSLKIG